MYTVLTNYRVTLHSQGCGPMSISLKKWTTTTTVLQPLYTSTCVSRHLQLRTGGFCWCNVLQPACPCWWQPAHSDKGEDVGVLLNSVIYTVSVLLKKWKEVIMICTLLHLKLKSSPNCTAGHDKNYMAVWDNKIQWLISTSLCQSLSVPQIAMSGHRSTGKTDGPVDTSPMHRRLLLETPSVNNSWGAIQMNVN